MIKYKFKIIFDIRKTLYYNIDVIRNNLQGGA